MDEIWLIRHGESESNAGFPTKHPKTTALTSLGMVQARVLAESIIPIPDLIITSPYLRAIQTAIPVIERFPATPVEEWPVHEFTYLNHKKYFQTTVLDRRPQIEKYWAQCNPLLHDGEDAESFTEFIQRMLDTLLHLRKLKGLVFVFSHGHVIRCLLWLLLENLTTPGDASMNTYAGLRRSMRIPNTSILKLRFIAEEEVSFSNFIVSHIPFDLGVAAEK